MPINLSKEDKDYLENHINTPTYEQCLKMYNNGKISAKRFNELVKQRAKAEVLQAYKEHYDYKNKQIAHVALDIAVSAIPMGGAIKGVKTANTVAKTLTPYTGRKIAEMTTKGTFDGALTGLTHGTLSASIDNEDPINEGIKEAAIGGVIGTTAGAVAGKVVQKLDGKALKSSKPKAHGATKNEIADYQKIGKEYYKNYLQETSVYVDDYGNIYFGGDNAGKTAAHNLDVYPDLKKQLKTAKKQKNTNYKDEKDRSYDHFENYYNGRFLDYQVEAFNNGEKHFKMIKETRPNSLTGTNPVANQTSPTSTIPPQSPKFNYPSGLYNKNTKEGIKTIGKDAVINSYDENKDKNNNEKINSYKSLVNIDGITYNGIPFKNWSKDIQEAFMRIFRSTE